MSPIFLLITNLRPKKKKSYFLHKQRPSMTLILSNLHLNTIILHLRTNFHHRLPFYLKPYLPQQPHPLYKFRHLLLHPSCQHPILSGLFFIFIFYFLFFFVSFHLILLLFLLLFYFYFIFIFLFYIFILFYFILFLFYFVLILFYLFLFYVQFSLFSFFTFYYLRKKMKKKKTKRLT